jgi:thioredoxin reductase (NADPH)
VKAKEVFDVIIMGTGPAGLQAAIHAARRKASVLVLGRQHKSSAYRAHIENYCCISGVTGEALLREGQIQAQKQGAVFLDEDVTQILHENDTFTAKVESGRVLQARSLVLAMGISRKKLQVPGEKELLGRGVSYCVDCDAGFFKDASVAVVGCESAAVTGALTLLFYAKEVHLACEKLAVASLWLNSSEKVLSISTRGERSKKS